MQPIITFGTIALIIQLLSSIEELITGFKKKWFITRLSLQYFLVFEIIHFLSWVLVAQLVQQPMNLKLFYLFLTLMFINAIMRVVWAISSSKYIPGIFTAPLHIINFFFFYYITRI